MKIALEESRKYFVDTVKCIPEHEATLCLKPESWSILGIVEHIVVSERALLGRFGAAKRSESSLHNPEREARFAANLRGRATRLKAPERAWPTGRFANLGVALEQFLAAR